MMLVIIDVVADDRDIVDDDVDDDRHIVDDSASRFPSSTGHCYVMVIISAAYFFCTYPYLYE